MQKLLEKLIQQVAKAGAYAPTGMGTDRASFKNAGEGVKFSVSM